MGESDITGDRDLEDVKLYSMNIETIDWVLFARLIKNISTKQTLIIDSPVIDISAIRTDFIGRTVNVNNLIVRNSLNISGGFSIGGIDFNSITKIIQTVYYSSDDSYPNDISNHYISASNFVPNINNGLSYELLNDFSINITPINIASKFKITTNLNYLTSNYNDTKLNLKLYYNIEPSGGVVNDNSEVLIANNLLGTDNTTFVYDLYTSNILITDLSFNLNDKILFYFKANNYNEFDNSPTNINYNDLSNNYRSTILYERKGNNLLLEEIIIP